MRAKREGSKRLKGQERKEQEVIVMGPRERRAGGETNDQGLREGGTRKEPVAQGPGPIEGGARGESEGCEIGEQKEQGLRGSQAKGKSGE